MILGAVVIVAALVVVGVIYFRQAGEIVELKRSSDRAQALVDSLGDTKVGLNKTKVETQEKFDGYKEQFPKVLESIEYGNYLYKIAKDSGVAITRLTASMPADTQVGAFTYSVSSFVIRFEGSIGNILKFINAIRTGEDFKLPADLTWSDKVTWTAEVTEVNIDVAASIATIKVNIYGYKG